MTGTFDDWAGSVKLDKEGEGFAKRVELPLGQKISYKVRVPLPRCPLPCPEVTVVIIVAVVPPCLSDINPRVEIAGLKALCSTSPSIKLYIPLSGPPRLALASSASLHSLQPLGPCFCHCSLMITD